MSDAAGRDLRRCAAAAPNELRDRDPALGARLPHGHGQVGGAAARGARGAARAAGVDGARRSGWIYARGGNATSGNALRQEKLHGEEGASPPPRLARSLPVCLRQRREASGRGARGGEMGRGRDGGDPARAWRRALPRSAWPRAGGCRRARGASVHRTWQRPTARCHSRSGARRARRREARDVRRPRTDGGLRPRFSHRRVPGGVRRPQAVRTAPRDGKAVPVDVGSA
mmetsp:Transcript_30819/g.75832  ORF Transcript_30819/g.75832 Transcript_30819/m.75832 type:complete len:228 (-) Transcript_30819:204-887(-)